MTTSKLPIFKPGNNGGLRYTSNCTFNSLHGVIRCSHTDRHFSCLGSIQRWKNTSYSGFLREESALPFWERQSGESGRQPTAVGFVCFSMIWVLEQSPWRGLPRKVARLAQVDLGSAPSRSTRLSSPAPTACYVAAAPKGRQGHGRGRHIQSRSKAVRAFSARARRLPGAPAPWRRYLGCRSGGTWRRPQVPGSGAGCGSGTGRRIQEVAAPPARHLPATLRPAPSTSRFHLQA